MRRNITGMIEHMRHRRFFFKGTMVKRLFFVMGIYAFLIFTGRCCRVILKDVSGYIFLLCMMGGKQ